MRKLTDRQKYIVKIIPIGSNNAKTFKELQERYNLSFSNRVFKDEISLLREMGYAIGAARSKNGGYFLIATEEERDKAVRQYRAQANKELDIVYQLERADLLKAKAEKAWG